MIVVCFTPKSGPPSPEFRETFSDGTRGLEKINTRFLVGPTDRRPRQNSVSIRCSKDFLGLQVGGRETINRIVPEILAEQKKIRE